MMLLLGKIFVGLIGLVMLSVGYLYVKHPFVYQDLALLPVILFGPDIAPPDPDIKTIEQFDRLAAEQFKRNNVRGAAIAIVSSGEVVWSKGYGYANVEADIPATADTPFKAASISKAVTGLALMHAVEAGHLDLDTDINQYLDFEIDNPRVAENRPITLRHLATHTAGISDAYWVYTNAYEYGDSSVALDRFVQNYFAEGGETYNTNRNYLAVPPGDTYEYSNIATGLAGHILERSSGLTVEEYTQTHIFDPLNLNNTSWLLADFPEPSKVAVPYGLGNRPIPPYSSPLRPAGGLYTSANDLGQLLALVMNGGEADGNRLLQAASIDAMLAKQTFPGLVEKSGEGIFWTYSSSGLIGHDGGDHGVNTGMFYNPETGIGIVVLTNSGPAHSASPLYTLIRQITTGETSESLVASLVE